MSKKTVSFAAMIGMTAGGSIPLLWGDYSFIDAPSILLGMVGGFAGIWAAVWLGKRYF